VSEIARKRKSQDPRILSRRRGKHFERAVRAPIVNKHKLMRPPGQFVQGISQPLQQFWQDTFFIVDRNSYGEAKSSGHAESSALTIPRFPTPSKARSSQQNPFRGRAPNSVGDKS
jgi:hypothetical protein